MVERSTALYVAGKFIFVFLQGLQVVVPGVDVVCEFKCLHVNVNTEVISSNGQGIFCF